MRCLACRGDIFLFHCSPFAPLPSPASLFSNMLPTPRSKGMPLSGVSDRLIAINNPNLLTCWPIAFFGMFQKGEIILEIGVWGMQNEHFVISLQPCASLNVLSLRCYNIVHWRNYAYGCFIARWSRQLPSSSKRSITITRAFVSFYISDLWFRWFNTLCLYAVQHTPAIEPWVWVPLT